MIRSLLLFSLSYGSNDRNYTRAGLDEIPSVHLPETLQCRPAIPYGHLQQILIWFDQIECLPRNMWLLIRIKYARIRQALLDFSVTQWFRLKVVNG